MELLISMHYSPVFVNPEERVFDPFAGGIITRLVNSDRDW